MEPPVSYPESDKYQGQQIYGRKSSGCTKIGCFGIIGAVAVIAVIIIIGYFFVFPALMPNSISGSFLDVTVAPGKGESPVLWILTDGSFNFIKETSSPGKHSVGRSCILCKLWLYNYDPFKKEIINKIKIEQEDIITQSNVLFKDNEVWVITKEYGENPPGIHIFNSENGEKLMGTKEFISKYEELSGGISEVFVFTEKPVNIRFKTKDGRADQIMDFESGKIYDGWANYNESKKVKEGEMNTLFVLSSKSGAPRKNLYSVTGPKNKVSKPSDVESYVDDESSLKFFANATSTKLLPNKGFIEGLIIYEDKDACVILHQKLADKDSDRMLSCVDASGNLRWEIDQKDLFDKARVDKDDPFSAIFFMKDKFAGMVQSGVFIFKLEGAGIMGFDFKTGKKLWEVEI